MTRLQAIARAWRILRRKAPRLATKLAASLTPDQKARIAAGRAVMADRSALYQVEVIGRHGSTVTWYKLGADGEPDMDSEVTEDAELAELAEVEL